MDILEPKNNNYLDWQDGNAMSREERLKELIKTGIFPLVVKFDGMDDLSTFRNALTSLNI